MYIFHGDLMTSLSIYVENVMSWSGAQVVHQNHVSVTSVSSQLIQKVPCMEKYDYRMDFLQKQAVNIHKVVYGAQEAFQPVKVKVGSSKSNDAHASAICMTSQPQIWTSKNAVTFVNFDDSSNRLCDYDVTSEARSTFLLMLLLYQSTFKITTYLQVDERHMTLNLRAISIMWRNYCNWCCAK